MNDCLKHQITVIVCWLFVILYLPACSKTPAGPEPDSVSSDNQVQQQKIVPPSEKPQNKEPVQYRELSVEDQIKAQNLLRQGQLYIELSKKLPMENPAEGIKACRKVLAEYGDTEYAQQAVALLRKVPQQYKKDYNITDEELGL